MHVYSIKSPLGLRRLFYSLKIVQPERSAEREQENFVHHHPLVSESSLFEDMTLLFIFMLFLKINSIVCKLRTNFVFLLDGL